MLVDYDGERTVEQLELIKNEDPDIIMLQEVHGRRKRYVDSALAGYRTFPEFRIQETTMGCLIYCRNSLQVDDIVSRNFASSFMERGFSAVCVGNTWYMTTHLESMDKPQFEALRQRQLAEMWEFIANKNHVVIGMDSNIKSDIKCPTGVSDIWKMNQHILGLQTGFLDTMHLPDSTDLLLKIYALLTRMLLRTRSATTIC